MPDNAAIAQDDRLRALMTDPEAARHGLGDLTMALHRDQLVSGAVRLFGDVRVELLDRFAADAACAAVLEQDNRPVARLGDSFLERSNI